MNKIDNEPAFKWWVPLVMQKRNQMINKVKKKYQQTTHKFGNRIPKTIKEALRLDEENSNHLWADAIHKEMSIAKVLYIPISGHTPEQARANQVDEL